MDHQGEPGCWCKVSPSAKQVSPNCDAKRPTEGCSDRPSGPIDVSMNHPKTKPKPKTNQKQSEAECGRKVSLSEGKRHVATDTPTPSAPTIHL